MAKDYLAMAQDLTLQELKKLLAVKQQLEKLERKRADLQKELAKVEKEIARLSGEKRSAPRTTRRATRKKAGKKVAKKIARKKTARRTAATGRVTDKTVKKSVKRAGKKTAGRPRLEDVIADLLGKHGGTMSVKDILGAFKDGKLFPTRSKNFENVLRRTLSTSKRIVRVGRGIYKLQ